MSSKKIGIIITSGDPAGIGLDLCIQLAYKRFPARITIIGNINALKARAKIHNKSISFNITSSSHLGKGNLNVIDVPYRHKVLPGKININNSLLQLNALKQAVDDCKSRKYDALVTLPIHKKALNTSKSKFTGHTEYISRLCKTENKEVMLLTNNQFRVALVTTHVPINEVSKLITKKRLGQSIKTIHKDLKEKFKIKNPHITVTGLNPHAGEGGEFGWEEIKIITPVIKKLNMNGINVTGPIPADTAFTPKNIKQTDCFLVMYHDQGLAAFKALSFGEGINVTLGLPIIRTSVDHGTALEMVGSKKINPISFFKSISLAIKLANK
jgi:4-hydroxythreonine-4-phosphate dehydrogenase